MQTQRYGCYQTSCIFNNCSRADNDDNGTIYDRTDNDDNGTTNISNRLVHTLNSMI